MLNKPNSLKRILCSIITRSIALALALLCTPILLVFAFAIYLESREYPIFIQKRLGLNGKSFNIVKLKTFYSVNVVADSQIGFTRLGNFLRQYRIDELPQFLNVVLGHMNFIGPRPEIADRAYRAIASNKNFHQRLAIKPGITGLAQVTQGHTLTDKGNRIKFKLDLYYLRNRGFKMDTKILIKTIKVLLKGVGR